MPERKNIVKDLLDRRCLITPKAQEVLDDIDSDMINVDKLADILKDEVVVTAEKLTQVLQSFEEILKSEGIDETISIQSKKKKDLEIKSLPITSIPTKEIKVKPKKDIEKFNPIGLKVKSKIKVIQDSTGKTSIKGEIVDFKDYFLSRYKQMKSILKKRGDVSGSIRIVDLQKMKSQENEQVSLVGMITEKQTLKNSDLLLEIEDPTGRITLIISSKMEDLIGKANTLLQDQVACFSGKLYENMFFLNDFTFPDIPILAKKEGIKEQISVCMTSDLHIGSKEFLEDSFKRLIDFLKGYVDDPYQRNIASQVKYLIINGDLVEGIGVYPKQEEDLLIADIYDQYKYAAKLLKEIPHWIQILIVSGNHDACQLALPQPAISKQYAPDLWNMPNVLFLSNPSIVDLHDKTFLLFHGNSFEDIAALVPGLTMNDPNGPMIYTLRYRHLAPTFGRRTSIVPSIKDELVIEKVPDVYHTGHIHINSHTQYRGVDCINSGTFQSQTEYMLSKNIIPTPGRVPILNLQSNKLHELIFYQEDDAK